MFRCLNTEFRTNRTITDRNLFTPSHKICSSVRRFSRNSKFLTSVHGDLAHRMLMKSDRTCRNYGQSNRRTSKYTVGFTLPIFTKLVFAERFAVWSCCTRFCINCPRNVCITDRNLLTPVSKVWLTASIFTKLILPQQIFVSNSYAEFHENPTNGLVAVLGHGQAGIVCTKGILYLLCENA
jgi:hypothetical protein